MISSPAIVAPESTVPQVDHSSARRAFARAAGLFYILVLAFDIAGLAVTASIEGSGGFAETARNVAGAEGLYRIGLCLALLGSLSTIPLAIALFAVVRPVDANLAAMALVFRSAESAIGAVGIVGAFGVLETYLAVGQSNGFAPDQLHALTVLNPLGASTQIAAIFFSAGSTVFFYLFLKSHYIPRIVAGWGLAASVVYLANWFVQLAAPGVPGLVGVIASIPILIAEVSTALWLLIAGIRLQR